MTPKSGYDAQLHEVCVGLGWCGGGVDGEPRHVGMFIPTSGPVTAGQFVDRLFQAEGMDPSDEPERWLKHKKALREAFIRHMGGEVVDARALK